MITQEFRKKVKKIFYTYKRLLEIPKYWSVSIEIDEKIKVYANVLYKYEDKKFSIKINPKLNRDITVLKDSILHELIHILFTPATSKLDKLVEKLENKEKINIKRAKKLMLTYEEFLVDRITKILIRQENLI